MRLFFSHALIASILALVCAQPASALDCDTAAACYDQGVAKYIEEEYGLAIVAFQRAYTMNPEGIHLANIAACYGRLGKYDKATEFAERADAHGDLVPAEQAHNTARLTAFRMHARGQRALESASPPPRFDAAPVDVPAPMQATEYSPSRERQGTKAILFGVGGVSLMTAALVSAGVFAERDANGVVITNSPRNSRQQAIALITLGVGTAALATGTVLVISDRRRRKKSLSIAPVLTPEFAGAQVGFTF